MKVRRTSEPCFKSFSIELEVQTEEEARALYAIFNHTRNIDLLPDDISKDIKEIIGDCHYVGQSDCSVIANGINGKTFYRG